LVAKFIEFHIFISDVANVADEEFIFFTANNLHGINDITVITIDGKFLTFIYEQIEVNGFALAYQCVHAFIKIFFSLEIDLTILDLFAGIHYVLLVKHVFNQIHHGVFIAFYVEFNIITALANYGFAHYHKGNKQRKMDLL